MDLHSKSRHLLLQMLSLGKQHPLMRTNHSFQERDLDL
jgi:hypothetical protein